MWRDSATSATVIQITATASHETSVRVVVVVAVARGTILHCISYKQSDDD